MNTEISLHFIGEQELWSELNKKTVYVLPYYDDNLKQQRLLKEILKIFERLGEEYEIKFIYNNSESYTGIEIDEFHFNSVKLDYLETEINRLKKLMSKKEKQKKIIIEI
jgi:hypothetical protein